MMRPMAVQSITVQSESGCGTIHLTAGFVADRLFETFIKVDHQEACGKAGLAALTRMISMALQHGIPPEDIISKLRGTRCGVRKIGEGGGGLSCFDVVATMMEQAMEEWDTGRR